MSLPLLTTALVLLTSAPVPPPAARAAVAIAAVAVDTTPDEAARAQDRRRALARRDSLRAQIARLRAACGSACDSSADRDDLTGLRDLGRVVGESVNAGMRGAADEIRRAVAHGFDYGPDYEPGPRDRHGLTRIDTTVAFTRGGSVDLSLVNGPVTVTAWDRAEVRVRGRSDHLPLRFERTDGPNGGSVRVYTVRTRDRSEGEQQLDVVVPTGTRVTANSISGDVRVHGVGGELDAETVSGDVEVEGTVRRMAISSVSGSVRAERVEGDLRAHSVSGDVQIVGARGDADVNSVSGNVDVRGTLGRLRARTVSGDVSYDGTFARDGRYDLDSQSGEVRLVLPSNVGAALSLQTFSGSIDTGIPLTLEPTPRSTDGSSVRHGRRLEFTLGGGGARITAQSFSGTIVIARATTVPRN
ncbi:MAG: DUF4097 domain-containing protein [Candidatus Eremiobacteraeota bacterium]|nr:DUF4097 domain-containing protein [Candidatus Eremiobacteraeota bacterium]